MPEQPKVFIVYVDREDGRSPHLRSVHMSREGAQVAGANLARSMGLLDETGFLASADFEKGIIAEKGQTSVTIETAPLFA